MNSLKLEIVTPDKTILSEVVQEVSLPGGDGELGVLPQHTATISTLQPGELGFVASNGQQVYMAVGEGFVEVGEGFVKVITDMALDSDEIDIAAEERAIERAKNMLANTEQLSSDEIESSRAILSRSLSNIAVKRKRRNI